MGSSGSKSLAQQQQELQVRTREIDPWANRSFAKTSVPSKGRSLNWGALSGFYRCEVDRFWKPENHVFKGIGTLAAFWFSQRARTINMHAGPNYPLKFNPLNMQALRIVAAATVADFLLLQAAPCFTLSSNNQLDKFSSEFADPDEVVVPDVPVSMV